MSALIDVKGDVKQWNSAWCWKEIDRLKKAAEEEYQRAEGKSEMKKYFQEEITKLKEKNQKMKEGINKCLDHWAIVAGPSAFERSGMRFLLEEALKVSEE